jgi:hypothetical protein
MRVETAGTDAECSGDRSQHNQFAAFIQHGHTYQQHEKSQHQGHHVRKRDEPFGGAAPAAFFVLLARHALLPCCAAAPGAALPALRRSLVPD